jgi:ribosomal protein S9
MTAQYYEGIGRRKESTARVRVSNGTGVFKKHWKITLAERVT